MDMTKFTYADSTGQPHKISEHGKTWVSDEWLASMGWARVADDYEAPATSAEVKQQKLVALAAEYGEDVAAINAKVLAALTNSGAGSAKLTAAQSEFSTRKAKYLADRAAIINS